MKPWDKPGPGWKSSNAICAERRGMLTRADLVARGCPQCVLDRLKKREWHHVWKDGRVRQEYYWTERDVLLTTQKLVNKLRTERLHAEARERRATRQARHAAMMEEQRRRREEKQ